MASSTATSASARVPKLRTALTFDRGVADYFGRGKTIMIKTLSVLILAVTLLAGCFPPSNLPPSSRPRRRPLLRARLGRSFRAMGCVGE